MTKRKKSKKFFKKVFTSAFDGCIIELPKRENNTNTKEKKTMAKMNENNYKANDNGVMTKVLPTYEDENKK